MTGHDYASPGAYFVTLCTVDWACLFGTVIEDRVKLNACGLIVQEEWLRSPSIRTSVAVDAFVVMPNHLHGILLFTEDHAVLQEPRFASPVAGSLGVVVGQFKGAVTRQVNALRGTPGATVWQRNYFERVIRNRDQMNLARHYIDENPARWRADPYSLPQTPQRFQ